MRKSAKYLLLILAIVALPLLVRYVVIQYQNIKYYHDDCFSYPTSHNVFEAWQRYHNGDITGRELRFILYGNDNRILICPFCTHDVVPIQYGLVDFPRDSVYYDLQGQQRVVLGGCMKGESIMACTHCDRYYRRLKPLLLDWHHERERLQSRYRRIT